MDEVSRIDFHARADANDELIARVAALMAEHWQPQDRFRAPNGATDAATHARVVLGIAAGGGSAAQIVGYLRRAEEDAFGDPLSSAQMRWALADLISAWSWNREPLPGDPGELITRPAPRGAT